jgi:hypothetical protein
MTIPVVPNYATTGVLIAGRSLLVNPLGSTTVVLTRGGTTVLTETLASGQNQTFGPFNLDINFSITIASGSATLTVQDAVLQVEGNSFAPVAPTKTLISSGGSATVGVGVTDIVLDGAATTFALTFPAPVNDGQVLHVMAGSAISVGFSAVVTAPATVIKTVPSTMAAGTGVGWRYNESNTTWYRQY